MDKGKMVNVRECEKISEVYIRFTQHDEEELLEQAMNQSMIRPSKKKLAIQINAIEDIASNAYCDVFDHATQP